MLDESGDFEPVCPGFESRASHDFFFFFFVDFLIYFLCFFFVIIITVQICKFNITVSSQFLLLYYSLWCPGLQRLQRFDSPSRKTTNIWISLGKLQDIYFPPSWNSPKIFKDGSTFLDCFGGMNPCLINEYNEWVSFSVLIRTVLWYRISSVRRHVFCCWVFFPSKTIPKNLDPS